MSSMKHFEQVEWMSVGSEGSAGAEVVGFDMLGREEGGDRLGLRG